MFRNVSGSICLDAELIASPVARLLTTGVEARIIQLFNRSVNLATDRGEYISLTLAGLPAGPFSISILEDGQPELSLAHILGREHHDLRVVAGEKELHIGRLRVNLRLARNWDPRLNQGELQGMDLVDAANLIHDFLYHHAPADSLPLVFLSNSSSWIGARMGQAWAEIRTAIRDAKPEGCQKGAQFAAGVGHGLTPAGDDFLLGVMLALWLGMNRPDPYIRSLLAGIHGRTGKLSTAFLQAAGRSEAARPWHDMARAIAQSDPKGIRQATGSLLRVGHTSGADALFGFALALKSISLCLDISARPVTG
jgi:hypothetical protein